MKRKIASRLKELREEKGLSLQALSKIVGISDSSLGRWERDENDITGDNLIILANFFGVSTDYLLGRVD